jgi:ABC-type lipoprotein export system ATPase subunit
VTILVVTHDPIVAAAADRTIHLRDGHTASEDTTEPLRERGSTSRSVA